MLCLNVDFLYFLDGMLISQFTSESRVIMINILIYHFFVTRLGTTVSCIVLLYIYAQLHKRTLKLIIYLLQWKLYHWWTIFLDDTLVIIVMAFLIFRNNIHLSHFQNNVHNLLCSTYSMKTFFLFRLLVFKEYCLRMQLFL